MITLFLLPYIASSEWQTRRLVSVLPPDSTHAARRAGIGYASDIGIPSGGIALEGAHPTPGVWRSASRRYGVMSPDGTHAAPVSRMVHTGDRWRESSRRSAPVPHRSRDIASTQRESGGFHFLQKKKKTNKQGTPRSKGIGKFKGRAYVRARKSTPKCGRKPPHWYMHIRSEREEAEEPRATSQCFLFTP